MQGDKDMAESLSSWYCDMGKVVIQSKHQQAEVMVLATTVLWTGCGSASVKFGVQNHD